MLDIIIAIILDTFIITGYMVYKKKQTSKQSPPSYHQAMNDSAIYPSLNDDDIPVPVYTPPLVPLSNYSPTGHSQFGSDHDGFVVVHIQTPPPIYSR